jgi:hypothetical protein
MDDAIEIVLPTRLCQLEVDIFALLLSKCVAEEFGCIAIFAAFALQMHNAGGIQENVIETMRHETMFHLRFFKIHEEGRVESTTFIEDLVAYKQVCSRDIIHLHPIVRISDDRRLIEVQPFLNRSPK